MLPTEDESTGDARPATNRSPDNEAARLASEGDAALAELFSSHRDRLERMVAFRLAPQIRGRIDAADVIQEAYLRIARRVQEYLERPTVTFYVWMRQQTLQVLIDLQRTQFREARSPAREVRLAADQDSDATSYSIACRLIDAIQSPSQVASKNEDMRAIQDALDSMNRVDREVLALRHFEQLSNAQVAEILNLSPTAASNRYVRAAERLGQIMTKVERDRRNRTET